MGDLLDGTFGRKHAVLAHAGISERNSARIARVADGAWMDGLRGAGRCRGDSGYDPRPASIAIENFGMVWSFA